MLSAFAMAFKTPELRKKIFFTLSIMALFRFGSVVPTPGVSYTNVQQCLAGADQGGLFGLINLFSGGALIQLSVFALGIMPYITASIIVQLLTVVIPRFETLKKEAASKKKGMNIEIPISREPSGGPIKLFVKDSADHIRPLALSRFSSATTLGIRV